MPWDSSPLLDRRTSNSSNERIFSVNCDNNENDDVDEPGTVSDHDSKDIKGSLTTFAGVFSPVSLSMFSTALFLRLGFVIGQSGLVFTLLQFALSYAILYLTILSICAISTNGRIKGGGAYFMISRSLGPEFGGSIGLLFFLANVVSCAVYVSGFVEVLVDNFGPGGNYVGSGEGLYDGNAWWSYLYASLVLFICLLISLTGGAMFAKTSVFIFVIVVGAIVSVFLSSFIVGPRCITYPSSNPLSHQELPINTTNSSILTSDICGNFTGFSTETFKENLYANYTVDYVTGRQMDFAVVFAILFSSVTGIMNGANMSGELKNASHSIPLGTLSAASFVLCIYIGLTVLISATCDRELLLNNYIFLQSTSVWSPIIVTGIFATTLSAALGNLIGASRVLEALALDELVLLIGSLNAIAPMASALFLLSYAATNISCLGLHLTSAPNFRPTFRYFSTATALGGLLGAMVMCFVISPLYASVSLLGCVMLVVVLHLRVYPSSWGSISQAIIFHQVRKYLLLLDPRKDHVKYWRPQMLLLVRDVQTANHSIDLINDMKKSGLFVIGHVKIGDLNSYDKDPCIDESSEWMNIVDTMKVKAFIELTLTSTLREGISNLIRLSGLGGMKPNTICIGFYGDTNKRGSRESFPHLEDYLTVLSDIYKLKKNLCILRNFEAFDKTKIFSHKGSTIDVWPQDLITAASTGAWAFGGRTDFEEAALTFLDDTTSQFMLQLSTVLAMAAAWRRRRVRLRFNVCVDSRLDVDAVARIAEAVRSALSDIRVKGELNLISISANKTVSDYNAVIRENSETAALVFAHLPADLSRWSDICAFSCDLRPPTLLVHGQHRVVSTNL